MYLLLSLTGSKGGKINSITVEGCDQEPCQARRNHDYGISVNFTASTLIPSAAD